MAKNPETRVTNRVRDELIKRGCHTVKLSDAFTRGVPDMMVVSDRVVMIEFKVDRRKQDPDKRTYKSLGLSGAQDHHIRQICRRASGGACVVTDKESGGKLRVWMPFLPQREGPKFEDYYLLAKDEDVYSWLTDLRT